MREPTDEELRWAIKMSELDKRLEAIKAESLRQLGPLSRWELLKLKIRKWWNS